MKLHNLLSFFICFSAIEAISMPTVSRLKNALLSPKTALISKVAGTVTIIGYLVNDLRVIGNALYEGQDGIRKLKRSELTALPLEERIDNFFYPKGRYYVACHSAEPTHWRYVNLDHGWKYYLNSDHCWYILDEQGNRIHAKHLIPDEKISEMREVLSYLHNPNLDLYDSMHAELVECENNTEAINTLFDKFLSRRDKIIADAKHEFQLRAMRDIVILGGLAFLNVKKLLKK